VRTKFQEVGDLDEVVLAGALAQAVCGAVVNVRVEGDNGPVLTGRFETCLDLL
jgi:hypothetical protein